MKFEAARAPLAQVTTALSHALVPSTNPSDISRYIHMCLDQKGLSFSVSRPDLFVKAVIDRDAPEPKAIKKVTREGQAVLEGNTLVPFLNRLRDVDIEADMKKSASAPKPDEDSGPSEIGRLSWGYKGGKSKKFSSFPCVDVSVTGPELFSTPIKATIYGKDFASMVKLVGVATGDASENDKYTCALVKTSKNKVEMVTANGAQLAWAKYDGDILAPMSCVVPYFLLQTAARIFSPDSKIGIAVTDENPSRLVLVQDIIWAEKPIGKLVARLNTTGEEFFNFEDKVAKLDFVAGCTFKTQQAKDAIDLVDVLKRAKTSIVFNTDDKMIELVKIDENGEILTDFPIDKTKGEKMQIAVSTGHLKSAIDCMPNAEFELLFSGPHSMAKLKMNENVSMYFVPFSSEA